MKQFYLMLLAGWAFCCASAEFLENAATFPQGILQQAELGPDGVIRPADGSGAGVFSTRVIDLGENASARFTGWVAEQPPGTAVQVEYRTAPEPFAPDAPSPAWKKAVNGAIPAADGNRYFQYRARLETRKGKKPPFLRELLVSTRTPAEKFKADGLGQAELDKLNMMMLYSVTPEKLFHVYSQLPYDASERGLYVLRNAPKRRIGADYRYQPGENEMYLPMRYGTRILARFHPVATFSNLSMYPRDVILRAKDGREKTGLREQHRTVNFFDRDFLDEYRTGLRAAVRYYREHNPYVFGYTLMSPEFFYDTEPWPQMTYLSGFSPEALAAYRAFTVKLGRPADSWPQPSDGDILLDPQTYLWAYWRSRAGADYIASLARIIREEDPAAQIGTMHYVGAMSLRGLEPGFIELNPDFDFYYSSNLYPRVPGKDGLDGGTTFSYTRLNVEGHSRKRNLLEYDLWSPYIDAPRALTYARYAALEGVLPMPIVLGNFPENTPSNHLTRYHGMKGSAVTPTLLRTLADNMRQVRELRTSEKFSQVAVILPSISLHALLEKDRWLPHRLIQQQLHVLAPLLELNASFDFLTEGYVTPELLDRYKLVIVQQPAVYPWMREALAKTRADLLVLGWGGTVTAPGPRKLLAPIAPETFDFTSRAAWARGEEPAETMFATGGTVRERRTRIRFAQSAHPLLEGLSGSTFEYDAPGIGGRPLAYVAGMRGDALASDAQGETVYAVQQENGRRVIHFGALPWQLNADGSEKRLFSPEQEKRFFAGILNFCGIEHYPASGPLRLMRNGEWLLVENTDDTPFRGTLPTAVHPARKLPEAELEIPALGSVLLKLPR
ncbi:hypothetical protein [Victivallis vadensis]|uniref:hypothetical protein n=1 Tax=Victivallis vadensis TaxID=172901 RepID=UPI000D79C8F8|nr:MAG: hypothetical protein DBX90_09800 [Lentisphaerota bacterium]